VESKSACRKNFLSSNLECMRYFLAEKVATRLEKEGPGAEVKGEEVFMQPDMIKAEMRDYQLNGLNWMIGMHRKNAGMILGDEMGLGKTLQTISLLCHLKETNKYSGASLVICPLSVLYSWCDEIDKWAPGLKYLRLHSSSSEERAVQKDRFTKTGFEYDVVITTYEMAKNPVLSSLFARWHFNYLVLDEGHKIKEHTSQVSMAMRRIHRENSLILTGTPLQNNLTELWSLLSFLYADVFTASDAFSDAFDIGKKAIKSHVLEMAHALLDLFMLRRLKDQVEKLLPPKVETKVICPLSKTQVFWYKSLLMKDISYLANISNADGIKPGTIQKLNNLVMQLRKCCNHPFQFEDAEGDIESTTLEKLIAASGKLAVLDKLLMDLFIKKHRTLLFSQFTKTLDIIEDYCCLRGWKYCRFDGGTARAMRNLAMKKFNAKGSDIFIFLMSTRSGGMGLNLQTADTCILFDSDWNPQSDIQAMARTHRIGQTKIVHVYRMITGGTVEERIVERAEKKLYLDRMVNGNSLHSATETETLESGSVLISTLKFGCSAVFDSGAGSQNNLPTKEEIALITDRMRQEDFSLGKLQGGQTKTTDTFDAHTELTATTKFAGVDFKALMDAQSRLNNTKEPRGVMRKIMQDWSQIIHGKRQRKSRLTMVQGIGSGYGSRFVPVLSSNNYGMEGECSVYDRELIRHKPLTTPEKQRKKKKEFTHDSFCFVCGYGGSLVCCPQCPNCMHLKCAGLTDAKDLQSCSHHRCTMCQKSISAAGGLLFPCQACPIAYCEDCLPNDDSVTLIGRCERFEKLGYSDPRYEFIHCSSECEEYSKRYHGWKEKNSEVVECPEEIDVGYAFGSGRIEEVAGDNGAA